MSKKTIGQYFSGPLVSDLLASLIDLGQSGFRAIDPMVGSGDMLSALVRRGVSQDALYGVDVDGDAVELAKANLPEASIIHADAFGKDASSMYGGGEWDLVITNPPYVRYQNLAEIYGIDPAATVRRQLIETLETIHAKQEYVDAAKRYPGTADLAVPSWILCAALVGRGGTLAMVLPNSWSTREYAKPVRDLLGSEFDVEYLVEDESRCWFTEAQISVNLLVARKKTESRGTPILGRRIRLNRKAASSSSLVGRVRFQAKTGPEAFRDICRSESDIKTNGLEAITCTQEALVEKGPSFALAEQGHAVLDDWGVSVGQGLRTGANGFFYFTRDPDSGMVSNDLWNLTGNPPVTEETLPLVPTLRYQNELPNGFEIAPSDIRHMVLAIRSHLPESACTENERRIDRYISYAENHRVNSPGGRSKYIPGLSAVRTNGPLSTVPDAGRYWYMLPDMKPRHRPDIVIPRINASMVRAWRMPEGRNVAADANFSTIWLRTLDETVMDATMALLNSTYFALMMERRCNILGGGALKCEATSIRAAMMPKPDASMFESLSRTGLVLRQMGPVVTTKLRRQADMVIASAFGLEDPHDVVIGWERELHDRIQRRNKWSNRKTPTNLERFSIDPRPESSSRWRIGV